MTKNKHLHRYKRKDISGYNKPPYYVYACSLPGCSHYLHKNTAEGAVGQCPECGGMLILDKDNLRRVNPLCEECR